YVTASGNYVFELNGIGYKAGYSGNANDFILISVAISADGAIIDCLTTKHKESKNYGDKCATDDYLDSWSGATSDDVVISDGPIGSDSTDTGAISGATYTSNGYQAAIKAAFTAFEIITEGGND
ncbi:MAG: FMN-binding protein, partial [Clostridia bacterium]|nr:FMN-binding protein [Clostridia bacterium]